MSNEEKGSEQQVGVRLLKEHTHAGIVHQPGSVIQVYPDQAAWLEAQKVGERVTGSIITPRAAGAATSTVKEG